MTDLLSHIILHFFHLRDHTHHLLPPLLHITLNFRQLEKLRKYKNYSNSYNYVLHV